MNSKKKNKNRQNKPSNPVPPQKQDVNEPSNPPQAINAEVVESVLEERVPNIISENVAAEVKEPEEIPKKPKRNRGKKKKEDEKSDKDDEVRLEESILDSGVKPDKDLSNETTLTARNNKNKKGQGPMPGEKLAESEVEKDVQLDQASLQLQEVSLMRIQEPENEIKPAKKKNKRKKNRNDSERSDKAEEISCTSAFQKLLAEDVQVKSISKPSIDDSNISEAMVKEVEIGPQANKSIEFKSQETLEKHDGNKSKKKNKKEKKQLLNPDKPKAAEPIQSFETAETKEFDMPTDVSEVMSKITVKETEGFGKVDESMPSSSTADEKNIKIKAKMAKPVEKKKKGNVERLSEDKPDQTASNVKSEIVAEVTSTKNETMQEVSGTDSKVLTEDLDDIVLVPLTEMIPDWQEEVKVEEKNGPLIGCEDKTETVALEPPIDYIDKNKNKKNSSKLARKAEIAASSSIPTLTAKLEETLLEITCSSKDQAELEDTVPLEEKSEIQEEEVAQKLEDKIGHIQVTDDHDITSKRKKSPKPIKLNEMTQRTEIPRKTLREIPKFDETIPGSSSTSTDQIEIKLEEKSTDKQNKIDKKATVLGDKNEQIHVTDNDKRKSRKKLPKPPKENEMVIDIIIPTENVQVGRAHVDKTLPAATNCPDILTVKPDELPEIKPDVLLEKTESSKDKMEHIQTPDSEKHQKRKKSPKPVIDLEVASSSKGTQQSKQNLKIEDIIIIQAEVVSDEKATKGNIVTACGDIHEKQDNVPKIEDKHDTVKPKKRKKSPRPPEKGSTKEIAQNTVNVSVLETQGEVQTPMTPNTQKLSSEDLAVELEMPKFDPMPSPNEVTPDFIEYPRCSSEQLDSNNNMVIQEISHSDATLEVPLVTLDAPFIQSTGTNNPGLVTSGNKVPNIKFENKPIDEKTDLKSKVLEVNKDMEDLRLSIERSLAEFTSLENTDKDAKTQMEEGKVQNSKSNEIVQSKPEAPAFEKQPVSEQTEYASKSVAEVKPEQEPICPARKDQKGKGKSKKKGKQDSASQNQATQCTITATDSTTDSVQSQDTKKEDTNKSEQKSGDAQEKEKKQASATKENKDDDLSINKNTGKSNKPDFEPIENFEDAMTSSVDDVNKTFEVIASEVNTKVIAIQNNPEINIIAPQEDDKEVRQEKQNPVSPPKNLLGHPDIPVSSNKTDYKKEKNKPPNYRQAKVKIKDANQVQIETSQKFKESKESQTELKRKRLNYNRPDESVCVTNQNDDYVYKYSFRKVFLQCACHVCKKDLKQTRVPCGYCNLIFYCNQKHKDEDYPQHQALCFAVSTIVHLKDQKFIYADAREVTGHNYRLLRMQMIVSCEKVLKRRLAPWEQEALLYPRMCGHANCREWRQGKLADCEGCGQISYCSEHPDHLPKTHSRWCKSYNLYRALVKHQQTLGRLEPKLPTRVVDLSPLPDNINEVLASMYEEKIDMSDIEYAALTQLATAPLTALFCLQHKHNATNGITKKSTLTLHIVGAELQFEADVLNKWEVFLLHLVPDVKELRVVLVGPDLNPSNLPLELLGKIKLCENCQQNKRRVLFGFQDKRTYHEFWASEDFTAPDLVCAFNPSIQRSSTYNGKDTWPSTINCILKLRTPFAITSYTLSELTGDLLRVQECSTVGYNVVCAPKNNSFASVRPDRNFISDDEAPLLFKNHCVTVVCGV